MYYSAQDILEGEREDWDVSEKTIAHYCDSHSIGRAGILRAANLQDFLIFMGY